MPPTLSSFSLTAIAVAASVNAYILGSIFYNLYLHPLSKFPGPLYMRATRLGYIYHSIRGTLPFDMLGLHNKYGEVVRISPNELAFATMSGWQDIQGHRTKNANGGKDEFAKSQQFYAPLKRMETDIINAGREEHGKLRRTMAHGFSDKGMREQQPIITRYIDLLIQRLHENCDGGRTPLDVTKWYNFTTFDIIGDLAFGEPFGCLETSQNHGWIKLIFGLARGGATLQALCWLPPLRDFLLLFVPGSVREEAMKHEKLSMEKLHRRMDRGKRNDLIDGLLARKDEWDITDKKVASNAGKLVIAGSETTATLLSGVTYYIMQDPQVLQKVTDEVRSTFESEHEIDFTSVNGLSYMLACLNEALRCYPPVATGLPRVVPSGGATVSDIFVPGGTIVSIHHWAMYHNERFWNKPFEYRPERFLGDEEFSNDVREIFQPFHIGPRNCIGRNLAYVEMRTILARVLFNFDLTRSDRSENWLNQKNFNLWEKPPLYAYLSPRKK